MLLAKFIFHEPELFDNVQVLGMSLTIIIKESSSLICLAFCLPMDGYINELPAYSHTFTKALAKPG